jgi:cystathionine gamma-synthase
MTFLSLITNQSFRRLPRQQLGPLVPRYLTSSNTILSTPAQAGRRAEELAEQLEKAPSDIDTLLSHAGVPKGIPNVPLAPPLAFASTYTRPSEGPYNEGDIIYSRMDNPTRRLLESTIYQLECSSPLDASIHPDDYPGMTSAFASGMMAASSIILAHQNNPLTVLLAEDVYHGVATVLVDVFQGRFGVQVQRVNMLDENSLEKELAQLASTQRQGSVIVWLETPSNPRCDVIDLAGVCQVVERCRKLNDNMSITTVTDSTLAPPTIQQPLQVSDTAVCSFQWSYRISIHLVLFSRT